jgi:hypothetical protein
MPAPDPMARPPSWDLDAELLADLTSHGDLPTALNLISRSTWWADPRVARAVPVVFPKTARIIEGRNRVGDVVEGVCLWTNQPAREAVFRSLGLIYQRFNGATVCHVYPGSPRLPAHFSRLSNLFVIPSPLAAFTEWEPVLAALKWRAFELYGYRGPLLRRPQRPPLLPSSWSSPVPLPAAHLRAIITRLRKTRATRPMFSRLKAAPPPEAVAAPPAVRDLAAEFIADLEAQLPLLRTVLSWVVRHSYFAPVRVEAACPHPLTHHRRPHRGERLGRRSDGTVLVTNTAAARVLLVSLGTNSNLVRRAVADHIYPDAPYLPAHFAHLGGLVLLPQALSSIADAPPIRAILQRHSFERTGYKGPAGREPPRPAWMPNSWPENRTLTRAQEDRAIKLLRGHRRSPPKWTAR